MTEPLQECSYASQECSYASQVVAYKIFSSWWGLFSIAEIVHPISGSYDISVTLGFSEKFLFQFVGMQ